jgi:ASC-1-like (ASCH) protein
MDHVAIMRKSWGLLPKILSGQKTIESRWYSSKRPPWNIIRPGDTVYFKDSGEPVTAKATVGRVRQFSGLTPEMVGKILNEYGREDGLGITDVPKFFRLFKDRRYCILVFLEGARAVEPFNVDKAGFGAMAAWLTTYDVNKIKRRSGTVK